MLMGSPSALHLKNITLPESLLIWETMVSMDLFSPALRFLQA